MVYFVCFVVKFFLLRGKNMNDLQDGSTASPFNIFNRLSTQEMKKAWQGIKSFASTLLRTDERALKNEDPEYLKELIESCINAKGGDVSARARAVEIGTIYLNLSKEGRAKLHNILAHDFDIDRERLAESIKTLEAAETDEDMIKAEIALQKNLIPPRTNLLRQFSALPNGFKFLIDMRADLLPRAKEDPALTKLALDLKNILSFWFDLSLLDLTEITWNSSAALLEKLIEYEAVHEIHSWDDLRRRLASDRLCFAFFHNRIPTEPLIFVEVALVSKLSNNIQELLEKEEEGGKKDTAIFYSISNTQPGLAGISLGNFLIKTVVEKLAAERGHLKHFATLSPVPGFRRWLDVRLADPAAEILTEKENEAIRTRYDCDDSGGRLKDILAEPWPDNREEAEFLKPVLLRLCARYLVKEKRKNKALDPVANFHLNNGAHLERLNWLADVSEKGISRSHGIMVNYYYKLAEIEKNHEEYNSKAKIAASREVENLLK